jgi:osmotically-inducible protein OsmY
VCIIARMRAILALAALAAAASTGGCAVMAVGAAAGVGMAAVQDRTAGEVMDDGHAYGDVKGRLMAADPEGFRDTHVEVYDGNLLLSGSVPDDQHHRTALMIARTYPSTRNVYDELQIGERTTFGSAVGDELIGTQLRARLFASPRVRAVNVNLEVFHGNVYLMGTARTEEELHAAAEIASTVGGVRRVVSFMEVIAQRQPSYYAATPSPAPQYAAAPPPAPQYEAAPPPPIGETAARD